MGLHTLTKATNFFPTSAYPAQKGQNLAARVNAGGSNNQNRNLSNKRVPIQLPRIKQDIESWIAWMTEAEQAFWPFRVKMQQGYLNTEVNLHVAACMARRKNLTLLRKFEFRDADGKPNAEWTKYFQRRWFKHNFVNYVLDAKFYGYNLISLGDIGSRKKHPSAIDCYPLNPTIITRWHISPDREEVANFIYSPNGTSFEKGIPDDYHVFVTTISTTGVNNCGYGLLYPAAYAEILMRSNTGFNADYVQMFAQPLRVLYTDAMEGPEQDASENALRNMGSSAYMILNNNGEKLEFVPDSAKGTGYKSYDNFDHRLKGDLSKLFLGHEDAISAVPGRMGVNATSGGPTSDDQAGGPVQAALADIQSEDGEFCMPVYNDLLLPKLRNLGIPVPEGGYIAYLNDEEEWAIQSKKNKINQVAATLAMTLAQAGKKLSNKKLEEMMDLDDGDIIDMPLGEGKPNAPKPTKEPKDAIESGEPFKEKSKERDGKTIQ